MLAPLLRSASRRVALASVLLATFASTPTTAAVEPGAPVELRRIATGLPGVVYAASPPGEPRLFLVNRFGLIHLLGPGGLAPAPFLDISDRVDFEGEGGLLSIAFAPDWATSGAFFVYYTADADGDPETPGDLTVRISRFHAIGDPATATSANALAEELLFFFDKPTAEHNGGTIAVRDGFLYVAIGDGGGTGDPADAAQDPVSPLGKMLRFDLSEATPAAEPWARGFRNPYRFSFDRVTGDLYVGDVGLEAYEEIDVEPASNAIRRNYGWDVKEGPDCFDDPDGGPDANEPACDDPSLVDPVYFYAHDSGAPCHSVTGGAVYRGAASPGLAGRYFFSDFCSGWLRSLRWDGAGGTLGAVVEHPLLPDAGTLNATTAIAEDGAGELVLIDYDGDVFRLVPEPEASATALVAIAALARLSAAGRSARRD